MGYDSLRLSDLTALQQVKKGQRGHQHHTSPGRESRHTALMAAECCRKKAKGGREEEIRTLTPLKRNKTEGSRGRAEMGKFPNVSLVWSLLAFGRFPKIWESELVRN